MADIQKILFDNWNYTDFYYPQKEIIESVLSKKDTLAILPTGGGKSLCYQIPAVVLDGITLVISPLIALMQDQVQNLNAKGIGAELINSQLKTDQITEVFTKCLAGKVKLLYIAPERLLKKSFVHNLVQLKVQLIAVDEAHCIAQWGHDFRPAYLKIHQIRELYPKATLLALTATATPKVQDEIITALQLKNSSIFKKSLKRENLVYKVMKSQNELDDLVYELHKNQGSSILFTRTRKQTFDIAQFLSHKGFDADFFHAKLPAEIKKDKQEIWTKDENKIIVSTNAFGMGIDKPNVRTVFHLEIPNSLEAYVQEAGRAGRDGNPALAELFLQPYAIEQIEKIFKSSLPTKKEYERTTRMFYNYFEIGENERPENKREFKLFEFLQKFDLPKKKTVKIIEFLERKEVISFQPESSYSSAQVLVNPSMFQFPKSLPAKILEYLVRNHPGILNQEKLFSEFLVAKHLQKSTKKIRKELTKLHENGSILFHSKEVRNVYFLRPRESDYIQFTLWKEFESFQITQWKRLQTMLYYAQQNEVCREKLILRYFGENPKENCGKCDVCLKKKVKIDSEIILKFLENSPKSIYEILEKFMDYPKESVLSVLQELSDENLVKNTGINSYQKS